MLYFSVCSTVAYVECDGLKPLIPWHHVPTGKTEKNSCWLKHERGKLGLKGDEIKSLCCQCGALSVAAHTAAAGSLLKALRATSCFCVILLC